MSKNVNLKLIIFPKFPYINQGKYSIRINTGLTILYRAGPDFKRQFFWLIPLTWMLPPVVGLGFILFVGILFPVQVMEIMLTPWEPQYIFGWLGFALWYVLLSAPVVSIIIGLPVFVC